MTNHTSSRIAGYGLIIGPACFALGDLLRRLVDSSSDSSPTELAAHVADHSGAWLGAGLLSVLAPVFFLPGVLALVVSTPGRGRRLVTLGGGLVGLGLLASVGHAVAFFSPPALYDRADTEAAAVKALDHASESYPLLLVLIIAFIVGMTIGVLLLLVGLRRARRVPVWSVVAGVVFAVAGSSGGVAAGVIGLVAALAAFAPAARSLITSPALAPEPVSDLVG